MTILLSIIFFTACVAAMAIGLIISKKALKKGCADSPEDCACRAEGKDPSSCDK